MHNRQTIINLIAAGGCFLAGLAIKFFLTPYVVRTLGADVYGFVGLSASIMSYTGVLSIAVNSMAGRFVTVAYQRGDLLEARRFYSSVFLTNLVLGGIIGVLLLVVMLWLEYLVRIPIALVGEVKWLFGLLAINNILMLVMSTWWMGAFIRNRVDVTSESNLIGVMVQALMVWGLFAFLPAHIWYIGVAYVSATLVSGVINYGTMRHFTADLYMRVRDFDWQSLWVLCRSGGWNVLNKLSDILGQGVDLLLTNLMIGSMETGIFAITKNIPILYSGAFATLSGAFTPTLIKRYAEGHHPELLIEVDKSIRLFGWCSSIPLVCIWVFGGGFYKLWLPGEDAYFLWLLTVLGTVNLAFAMPLEIMWNVFMVTDRLKGSTLFMLWTNLVMFAMMIGGVLLCESAKVQLLVLASVRLGWAMIRTITFLPLYGASCLQVLWYRFYGTFVKVIVSLVVGLGVAELVFMMMGNIDSWWRLIEACLLTSLVMMVCNRVIWWWRRLR